MNRPGGIWPMTCSKHRRGNAVTHRARWVFPVSSPPICNGAVVVSDDRIEAVGGFRDLKGGYSNNVIDHGEGSILPALVNAHTHLELAAMRGRISAREGFVNWIRELIKTRQDVTPAETEKAITDELATMHERGVGLIGDIGNTEMAYSLSRRQGLEAVFFLEFLGFNREKTETSKKKLAQIGKSYEIDGSFNIAAHAPYTVSAELFCIIKAWANKQGKLLSVHLCECQEEQELLIGGNGFLRDLLKENAAWDDEFKPPGESAIPYLNRLGILDSNTICVHLVHISEEDMTTLATRRVKCCLCPGSNLFLQVGFPDVGKMLAYGLRPALGTDSLASNYSQSILEEMATLMKHVPVIPPEQVLEMATLNGARTLGQENRLGSLTPGKKAKMIFVPGDGTSSQDVLEKIIDRAHTTSLYWIN